MSHWDIVSDGVTGRFNKQKGILLPRQRSEGLSVLKASLCSEKLLDLLSNTANCWTNRGTTHGKKGLFALRPKTWIFFFLIKWFHLKNIFYTYFYICACFAIFTSIVKSRLSHAWNASKQEPLELFCFILAVVRVTFVFLLLLHIVVVFFFSFLTLREYHCGTMTVTARRGNRGALAADGSTHFFIS